MGIRIEQYVQRIINEVDYFLKIYRNSDNSDNSDDENSDTDYDSDSSSDTEDDASDGEYDEMAKMLS